MLIDAVDVFESLPTGTVRGNTSFRNIVLRPSHEYNNFRSPDCRVDSLASFYSLCLFLRPRQHQSERGVAARHLTNVSILAISLPLNQAVRKHVA